MNHSRLKKSICSMFLTAALMATMVPTNMMIAKAANSWDEYSKYLNSNSPKKEDMRATWITTVYNSDWPSEDSTKIADTTERVAKQKEELCKILDNAVSNNINAVMFQVRSQCDAMYKSKLAPWSIIMTGEPGKDPGFDPLQYALDEAHKRGLELHAWMNPYRAGTKISDDLVAKYKSLPESIWHTHPEWIKKAYDGTYVIDPGIQEARKWVEQCIMEVVDNYDVDGIHFDDYFYHEGAVFGFDDVETFKTFANGFTDRGDWRRNNTYMLIDELSQQMRKVKPWVKLGISPAGMWGNKKEGHPNGSLTAGGEPNYDRDFADTLRWANDGIIDYVCPQVYWPFGRVIAPYGEIATWWANHITNPNTRLYIGMGVYRVNDTGNPEESEFLDPNSKNEMIREIQLNQNYPNISGSCIYQSGNITAGSEIYKKDATENGIRKAWAVKDLAPTSKYKSSVAPAAPKGVAVSSTKEGTKITWQDGDTNGCTQYFAVYRFLANDTAKNTADPTKLIAVVGKDVTSFYDKETSDSSKVSYVVTALDNLHNESLAKAVTPVSAEKANIETAKGTAPKLPLSVKVKMSDGSTQNMMVIWDDVNSESYKTEGTFFDVAGKVIYTNGKDTGIKASVKVTVVNKKIKYICPVIVKTEQFTAPVFPEKVDAIYSDNSVGEVSVKWPTPSVESFSKAATKTDCKTPTVFGLEGTVEGTTLKAEGNYIVYPAVDKYADVNVKTHAGTAPILPKTVEATYTDTTTENVDVVWDEVSAEKYEKVGTFEVCGTVAGAAKKVTANVTVEPAVTIVDTDPVYVKTPLGVAPKMPETVNATFNNGTKSPMKITWEAVDPAVSCKSTHRFNVVGTVNDSNVKVNATVEVVSNVVLDDFENGKVDGDTATSKIEWSGDSVSNTPPTLSYDTTTFHDGKASLKVAYNFEGITSTASAYVRPNQGKGLVFNPGEVPAKIGFWVRGNNVKTFAVRCEFRSGTTITSSNNNVTINDTLDFTGWKYLEYPVDAKFQKTGLCITLLPGIIEISKAAKVNTAIYIDNLTATYGNDTIDKTEITEAIAKAKTGYDKATAEAKKLQEYSKLKTAINSATVMKDKTDVTMGELYTETDALNAALSTFNDKVSLQSAIAGAKSTYDKSVEGNKPGQFSKVDREALKGAINKANTVLTTDASTHAQVETAKVDLAEALKTFSGKANPALVVTELQSAIANAKTVKAAAVVGDYSGEYAKTAVDALSSAIDKANTALTNKDAAQADIDSAAKELEGAVETFKKEVVTDNPKRESGLSEKKVVDEIANGTESTVSVPLTKADTVSNSVFKALSGKDKTLEFKVSNNGKLEYSWTFKGTDIVNKDVDLNLLINTSTNGDSSYDKLLSFIDTSKSLFINFTHHGIIPGKATVKVFVGDKYKDGDVLTLYYVNTDSAKLETIAENLTVKDGYLTFDITHCSTYLLAPKAEVKKPTDANIQTEPKNPENTTNTTPIKNPKTGKENSLFALLTLFAASGAMLLIRRKKTK